GPNVGTFTENVAQPHVSGQPTVFDVAGRLIPPPYLCPAGVTDQASCTPMNFFAQCAGSVSVVGKIAGNPPGGLQAGTTVATATVTLQPNCTYLAQITIPRSALR